MLLHELDEIGGAARPRDIYPKLPAYFPEITEDDLARKNKYGGSTWSNRVQSVRQHLVEARVPGEHPGCLDTHGLRTPVAAGVLGPTADYSQVPKPPPPSAAHREASSSLRRPKRSIAGQPAAVEPLGAPTPAPAPILVVADPTEKLCSLLQATQRQSSASEKFEQALTEAFAGLGFEARHIGGSGETDIFISARLGQASYSAVLDAKSTQSGRVPDAQINWPVIDSHRQTRGATYAAVIGEDFSGGQLQRFADQYKVTLLTTAMLCETLRLHARTPFSLIELRDLFSVYGRADQALVALRQRNAQHLRHWRLLTEIVDTMEVFNARLPGGFSPNIEQLRFLLTTQSVTRGQPATNMPTRQEVTEAVGYLASRAVRVLVEVPGSSGDYNLAMSAATARKRVLALARSLEEAAPAVSAPTASSHAPDLPS